MCARRTIAYSFIMYCAHLFRTGDLISEESAIMPGVRSISMAVTSRGYKTE